MIVTERIRQRFIDLTKEFLHALASENYDLVWNNLITKEAADLLATMSFPIMAYNAGRIDQLLLAIPNSQTPISIEQGLALAFQMDTENIRSGTFEGMAEGLKNAGWTDVKDETCMAFLEDEYGVLIGQTSGRDIVMPIINYEKDYVIDFEALAVFSMFFSASKIYKIGVRAIEKGRTSAAMAYFETAASFAKPIYRLRKILLDHPFANVMITPERKTELLQEETAALMARDQVLRIMASSQAKNKRINTPKFLEETFCNYREIPNITITEIELLELYAMKDGELRKAIAEILCNVNKVEALREAEKPHSPAEIADMEVKVNVDGENYLLCLPFKSGREIKSDVVPVDVAYQIIRPFMYFPNSVVVFITAKPYSQYLLNYIKIASETQGWVIEVIQDKELARLLKINGKLRTSNNQNDI